jgi:DNA adenine methylase
MDQESEHRRLLEMMTGCASGIVVSGYRNPLYDEVLSGWRRIDFRVRQASSDLRAHAVESVWVNR